jgi:hypothetical protein
LVSYALTPPPLPLHAVSEVTAPLESRLRVVPPTPTTFGELEGHITPAPLSPLDAKKTMPGVAKYES